MTRSVVVTGATSGIGLATALELARAGYDVIGTARSAEKAEQLSAVADARGLGIRTVLLDVTDAESTVRGFTAIAGMTDGGPWAVVNNAGIAQPGAVEDVGDDAARAQLETNVLGPARIARLVLPTMRKRRDGRIVMVSSTSGRVVSPFIGWYAASKHALEALTDALRIEVAQFGVKVVLIEPGSYGTGIWERAATTLPPREHSAYTDSYDLVDEILGRARTLGNPTPVGRAVRAALENPRPRARYLVGADAKAATALETVLPTMLSDYVKEVATGLRTPPERLDWLLRQLNRRRVVSPRTR